MGMGRQRPARARTRQVCAQAEADRVADSGGAITAASDTHTGARRMHESCQWLQDWVTVLQSLQTAGVAGAAGVECYICGGCRLYTWGWNQWGQLGHGTTTDSFVPLLVEAFGNAPALKVSCGAGHTMGLLGYTSCCSLLPSHQSRAAKLDSLKSPGCGHGGSGATGN